MNNNEIINYIKNYRDKLNIINSFFNFVVNAGDGNVNFNKNEKEFNELLKEEKQLKNLVIDEELDQLLNDILNLGGNMAHNNMYFDDDSCESYNRYMNNEVSLNELFDDWKSRFSDDYEYDDNE